MINPPRWTSILYTLLVALVPLTVGASNGITPEQIYQSTIDWQNLVGTWEVLPEENPLSEDAVARRKLSSTTLVTFRKDGTCRMFSPDIPSGSDGLWTFEDHEMYVKMQGGREFGFYVYGLKGDFMITRSPIVEGRDQLWSRVK